MIKICDNCNKEYKTNKKEQKCCSRDCRNEFNKKNGKVSKSEKRRLEWEQMEHSKICPICNSEFELSQQFRFKKYCSKSCRQKAERVIGCKRDTDLKYKDEIRFDGNREKALQRDNYECQMCNNKSNLIVHHIDCSGQSDNVNNELDNLTTLCRKCHINLHKILNKKK